MKRRSGFINIAILGALLVVPSLAMATGLNYPDFSSTSGMTLLNSATTTANRLRLTSDSQQQFGQAWFNSPQDVSGSFEVEFDYQLTGGGPPSFGLGDGFALVIQNDPNGTNATGSDAGGGSVGYSYWPFSGAGLSNSLAIEFNSNDQAIYVQSCGTGPTYSRQFQNVVPTNCTLGSTGTSLLNDGGVHQVNVSYDGANLSVAFDGALPVLTTPVTLSSLLSLAGGTDAYFGFTAGSGGDAENADILNFSTVPEPASFGLVSLGLLGLVMGRRNRAGSRS